MKSFFTLLIWLVAALPPARADDVMMLNTRTPVAPVATGQALPFDETFALPCDARSVHIGRYPLGPGGTQRLVHLWFEPSNLQPGDDEWAGHHTPVMFKVDIFEPGATVGSWKRVAFGRYKSSNWPDEIEARFLQPKAQRGAVIAIVASTLYGHSDIEIVTMRDLSPHDETLPYTARRASVQRFIEHPQMTQRFGVDARGILHISSTKREDEKPASTTVYAWNGSRYVARVVRR